VDGNYWLKPRRDEGPYLLHVIDSSLEAVHIHLGICVGVGVCVGARCLCMCVCALLVCERKHRASQSSC